ncbi:MAG: hypothetical protein G01um10147_130 [Microgenomates group bacterium Gr01-1014_7]|nr:MAG: hypothetical protein G01um10147_130 [Microgenomates group bacterium Gr01-1014_7]
MERLLSDCGYHVITRRQGEEKLPFSDTGTGPAVVKAEISCSNCQFTTQTKASGATLKDARSKAIVEANEERKKFCPILKPRGPFTFTPGEKRVLEYFSPTPHIEQNPQPHGWTALS